MYALVVNGRTEVLSLRNFAAIEPDDRYPAVRDPVLGYRPEPGRHWTTYQGGYAITIGPQFNRLHLGQRTALPKAAEIVAVGDSFTFGDQVDDDQTWPSHLQRLTGRTVVNGGVVGYSVAQAYLVAVAYIDAFAPQTLIFSLIPEDVARMGYAVRAGAPMPVPVVDGEAVRILPAHQRASVLSDFRRSVAGRALEIAQATLGYSFLFDRLLSDVLPQPWRALDILEPQPPYLPAVTCRLLADLHRRMAGRLLVLIQYGSYLEGARAFDLIAPTKTCLLAAGIRVRDTLPDLQRIRSEDPARFAGLFNSHMTAAGNRLIGGYLHEALSDLP